MGAITSARRLLPALLLPLVGCIGSTADVELLEARLRDQQDLAIRYQQLADNANHELTVVRKESDLLRTQLAQSGASPLLPEHADMLLRAEKISFHPMMTGARSTNQSPGDNVLNIVLTPQSKDGETIRLIGELEIEAIDLSRPQGDQRIGRWTFTPEQAREHWHAGFLSSGYQMDLSWATPPHSPEVLLHARMRTADGRQFDTSHQIRVDVPQLQTVAYEATAPKIQPRQERQLPSSQVAHPVEHVAARVTTAPAMPLQTTGEPRLAPPASLDVPEETDAIPLTASGLIAPGAPSTSAPAAAPIFPTTHESVSIAPTSLVPAPVDIPRVVPSPASPELPRLAIEPTAPAAPAPATSSPATSSPATSSPATPFPVVTESIATERNAMEPSVAPAFPERLPGEKSPAPLDMPEWLTPEAGATELPPPPIDVQAVDLQASSRSSVSEELAPLGPPQRFRRNLPAPGQQVSLEQTTPTPPTQPVAPLTSAPAMERSSPALLPVTPRASTTIPASSLKQTVPVEPPSGDDDAAPFPIDMTPRTRPVEASLPTSVNWTDDSIPYLR